MFVSCPFHALLCFFFHWEVSLCILAFGLHWDIKEVSNPMFWLFQAHCTFKIWKHLEPIIQWFWGIRVKYIQCFFPLHFTVYISGNKMKNRKGFSLQETEEWKNDSNKHIKYNNIWEIFSLTQSYAKTWLNFKGPKTYESKYCCVLFILRLKSLKSVIHPFPNFCLITE